MLTETPMAFVRLARVARNQRRLALWGVVATACIMTAGVLSLVAAL